MRAHWGRSSDPRDLGSLRVQLLSQLVTFFKQIPSILCLRLEERVSNEVIRSDIEGVHSLCRLSNLNYSGSNVESWNTIVEGCSESIFVQSLL